ncbi:Trm112 family protein [Rhodanobacter sp. Si-c]|uniref:Trm112 family protein n=1 Tax=Rhodanobacter lycopersici TaxID=3162487 RepID=A0ABV3QBU0_9GAMM
MDKRLLDILCCPVNKTPVRLLSRAEMDALNGAITAGGVVTTAGNPVRERIDEGLITTDRKLIYRVDDGIPVMLPEEGIGATQLNDFPTAP